MKERFGRSEKKSRVSVWIPIALNERLDSDSKNYGVTKTSIITTALFQYYLGIDSRQAR